MVESAPLFGKRICPHCKMRFKDLEAHIARKHPQPKAYGASPQAALAKENSSSALEAPPTQGKLGEVVEFVSPHSPGLCVVIRPERKGFVNTEAGSISAVLPGKRVYFIKGLLKTSDPEVIAYLDAQYSDKRFPVVNLTRQKQLAKGA